MIKKKFRIDGISIATCKSAIIANSVMLITLVSNWYRYGIIVAVCLIFGIIFLSFFTFSITYFCLEWLRLSKRSPDET